jgi:hypothetical protein
MGCERSGQKKEKGKLAFSGAPNKLWDLGQSKSLFVE